MILFRNEKLKKKDFSHISIKFQCHYGCWYDVKGETVRKLKIRQIESQNIVTGNINNNEVMWSENFKKEFSDSLIFGGDGGYSFYIVSHTKERNLSCYLPQSS